MGRERGMLCAWLGALLVVTVAAPAFAEVTTERPGSIIVFPKVIASGTRDTIIQISNTSNSMVHVHCFYVNAALQDPSRDLAPDNLPIWQETDFDIWLTKQQPTHWVASLGRRPNPLAPECTPDNDECNDAGLAPGRIPPLPPDFVGELKCIEVDSSGAPISGNHLKGEATLVVLATAPTNPGDSSKYNAISIFGLDTNDANNTLCLGGGATPDCKRGAEYDGCPQTTLMDNFSYGATNPQLGESSNVTTQLTIAPCSEDFERQVPGVVTVQFLVTNEFEDTLSTSTTVTCWENFELTDVNRVVFSASTAGSRFLQTRMVPATPSDSGFLAVAEEFHHLPGLGAARAAFNLYTIGERPTTDLIVLPEGP
jgi:hypothetical protein